VVTVIEAHRGQYHQVTHVPHRFPPEGKESPFGCPEMLSPTEPSLVDHHLGLRMDLV
jgi:hypothetical protein